MSQRVIGVAIDGPSIHLATGERLINCDVVVQGPTVGRVLFTKVAPVIVCDGHDIGIEGCRIRVVERAQ